MSAKPKPAADLVGQLQAAGWPAPCVEYRFHSERRWRFDLAYAQPNVLLAVEIDGGAFVGGGHTRGAGFKEDRERDAEAMCLGWRVLRVLPQHVRSGEAAEWISRILTRDWKEVSEDMEGV